MAQFNGVIPEGIDLGKYKGQGLPDSMIRQSDRLSDHNPKRDARLKVDFFQDSYFERKKSELAGRMLFSTRDFIRIVTDSKTEYCNIIKFDENGEPFANARKWLTRFPETWRKYKEGKVDGTPLNALPNFDPGMKAALEYEGIKTLESLVTLEGAMLQVEAVRDAKRKAQAFLETSDVLLVKGAENEALKNELAEAEKRIAELQSLMSDSAVESPESLILQPESVSTEAVKRKRK